MSRIFQFHHTRRTDMPSHTHFLFVVQSHRWSFFSQPSMVMRSTLLSQSSGSFTYPAQPLAATEGAVWLALVREAESCSIRFSCALAGLTLPGSAAFLASNCHCQFSFCHWLYFTVAFPQDSGSPDSARQLNAGC